MLVIVRAKQYTYTAKDIAEACLEDRRWVYRCIDKGYFDPKSFWSTFSFVQSYRLGKEILKGADSKKTKL